MPSSKEDREKQRQQNSEDTEHVLHELWNIHPSTPFCNSFKHNFERDLLGIFDDHATCADDELKATFHASELEVREMKTLCFYSHCFFCKNKNKPIKRLTSIARGDYHEFKRNPRLWKLLESHQQATLQRYLDSPILEIADSLTTIPSSEHSLGTAVEEESSTSSFEMRKKMILQIL